MKIKHAYFGAAFLAGIFACRPVTAQAPPHWQMVTEPGGAAARSEFVIMRPGWHITTGSAALLFDSRRILEDRFTLTTELFVFPETQQEGYGIFVGGRDLQGAAQYLALQLRRDGQAAVVQRKGGAVKSLLDWKPIASVGPHPGKDQQQRITMSIDVDSTSIAFTANGAEIGRLPRSGLDLNGQFGFSLGSNVNLHVVRLDTSEKLAPARRPAGAN